MSHVVDVAVQSTQAAPPDPQRVLRNPPKHVLLWQQPGHVFVVHVAPQTPL